MDPIDPAELLAHPEKIDDLARELGQFVAEPPFPLDVESGSLCRSSVMSLPEGDLEVSRAWVIPWKEDEGLFGIAWERVDGGAGCCPAGTRIEAEAVVAEIERQRAALHGDNVIDLMKAVGKRHRG